MLAGRQIIWDKEQPQPVVQSPVKNASTGSLPAVAAYVAVHPDFGAHVFFPYHGAKYGRACKAEDGRMYGGVVWRWDAPRCIEADMAPAHTMRAKVSAGPPATSEMVAAATDVAARTMTEASRCAVAARTRCCARRSARCSWTAHCASSCRASLSSRCGAQHKHLAARHAGDGG